MRPSTTDTQTHNDHREPGIPRRVWALAPLVALVALAAACSDTPDADAVDAFAEDPDCFGIELVDLEADEVACGTVTVPLHHDDPNGESLTLGVATLIDEDASGEPILVLGGGPGEVVIENALTDPMTRQMYSSPGREVILLDQRGVGSSDPGLGCDAFDTLADIDVPSEQDQRDASVGCRDELMDRGVDLDAFDHVNNARDVDLVRRALGHDELVVRGTSYGTHLALHAAALAPDGFSALVLSSPADPTDNYLESMAGGFQSALDRLDEVCAADERCTEQVGGIHQAIDAVADQLTDEPEEVTATPVTGGEPVTRTYTPETFVGAVFTTLYLPDGGLGLPSMLAAARQGDLEPLATIAVTMEEGFADIPQGMNLAMLCSGEGAFFDAETASADLHADALIDHWYDVPAPGRSDTTELCELWDLEPSFDPGQLALAEDVPTLLFTGEVDHVTPPGSGEQLHEQLPNSQLIEVRALAHGPLEGLDLFADGCGSDIIAAFLDDPESEPDTTCTRQIPSLDAISQFLP